MKNRLNYLPTGKSRFVQYCRLSYHGALAQLQRIKESIQAEFAKRFQFDERMLRMALMEAEAEAWETGYPQLVFPSLAEEKAQAVIKWQARQNAILREGAALAFAE